MRRAYLVVDVLKSRNDIGRRRVADLQQKTRGRAGDCKWDCACAGTCYVRAYSCSRSADRCNNGGLLGECALFEPLT